MNKDIKNKAEEWWKTNKDTWSTRNRVHSISVPNMLVGFYQSIQPPEHDNINLQLSITEPEKRKIFDKAKEYVDKNWPFTYMQKKSTLEIFMMDFVCEVIQPQEAKESPKEQEMICCNTCAFEQREQDQHPCKECIEKIPNKWQPKNK